MFFCRASLAHWDSSLLSAEAFNDLQGDYADAVLPFDHAGRGAAGGCWVKSWELLHHLDSHTGPSTHVLVESRLDLGCRVPSIGAMQCLYKALHLLPSRDGH